jgi:hypothetical protein
MSPVAGKNSRHTAKQILRVLDTEPPSYRSHGRNAADKLRACA